MPREHARLLTSIWQDADFRALDAGQQRAYMLLISQPGINWAGVLSLTPRRWAALAADTSVADVNHDLKALQHARFVVVDEDTEELLIRSFIRNDGVCKQPNVLTSAIKSAHEVQSPRLRAALAEELRRLVLPEPKSAKAKWPDVVAAAAELAPNGPPEPPPEGFGEPFENPSVNPEPVESENRRQEPLTEGFREGLQEPLTEPPGDGEGVQYPQKGHLSEGVKLRNPRARAHTRTRTRGTTTHQQLADSAAIPEADRIVRDWRAVNDPQNDYRPQAIREIKKIVDGMVRDGCNHDRIRDALDEFHRRPDLYSPARMLPKLYDDAVRAAAKTVQGRPATETSSKADAYRALADELRREEQAAAAQQHQPQIGQRRGPIGIVIEGESA